LNTAAAKARHVGALHSLQFDLLSNFNISIGLFSCVMRYPSFFPGEKQLSQKNEPVIDAHVCLEQILGNFSIKRIPHLGERSHFSKISCFLDTKGHFFLFLSAKKSLLT
jgi:hypothetical protein